MNEHNYQMTPGEWERLKNEIKKKEAIQAAEAEKAAEAKKAAEKKLIGDGNGQYCNKFINQDDLIARLTKLAKEQDGNVLGVNNLSIKALDFTDLCCAIQKAFPYGYLEVEIVQCGCIRHDVLEWDGVSVRNNLIVYLDNAVNLKIDFMLKPEHDISKIQIINIYIYF